MITIFGKSLGIEAENPKKIDISNFPDGETIARFFLEQPACSINICWFYENDAELMALAQIYQILKNNDVYNRFPKNLYIPYLPHARQDRDATKDTCNAVAVFINILSNIIQDTNTQVYTLDVHSSVSADIFESQSYNRPCPQINSYTTGIRHRFLYKNINSSYYSYKTPEYDAIISPDKGAVNRARLWWDKKIRPKLTEQDFKDGAVHDNNDVWDMAPNHKTFIVCSKNRDPDTGKLSDPSIDNPKHVEYLKTCNKVLIVDDIGTGFGTHIQLGNAIKRYNPNLTMDLFVSHSSFTRGKEPVLEVFNDVYTTNSLVQGWNIKSTRVTRFDCTECLPEIL